MYLKTLTFHLLGNGSVDVHYHEEGGATTSFDPAQLPEKLAALLPTTLTAALVRATEAEAKAKEAEASAADALAKVEAVAGLVAAKEQLAAKDANIQALMAELESLKK